MFKMVGVNFAIIEGKGKTYWQVQFSDENINIWKKEYTEKEVSNENIIDLEAYKNNKQTDIDKSFPKYNVIIKDNIIRVIGARSSMPYKLPNYVKADLLEIVNEVYGESSYEFFS